MLVERGGDLLHFRDGHVVAIDHHRLVFGRRIGALRVGFHVDASEKRLHRGHVGLHLTLGGEQLVHRHALAVRDLHDGRRLASASGRRPAARDGRGRDQNPHPTHVDTSVPAGRKKSGGRY